MSTFRLQNFQAKVLGQGLARTNRFEVFITVPSVCRAVGTSNRPLTSLSRLYLGAPLSEQAEISLMCEQASFPFLNLITKPYRIYGPAEPRPVVSDYGGEGVALTFHIDRQMQVKRFFDNWMQSCISKDSHNVRYQDTYATNIEIKQLDEAENITYEIILEEAFPRSMNLVELNHAAQNQTHRLTVLFAYRKWRQR